MSKSESQEVKDAYSKDVSIHYASGAGYKLLCAIQGQADAYIISKSSTFKWDLCGPHAILLSMGGGIVKNVFLKPTKEGMESQSLASMQIVYHKPDCPENTGADTWCNHNGFIAYRSEEILYKLLRITEKFL